MFLYHSTLKGGRVGGGQEEGEGRERERERD